MGHIKEPEGVDFVNKSRPLTKEEETAISAYIREYKKKNSSKVTSKKAAKKVSKRNKNIVV